MTPRHPYIIFLFAHCLAFQSAQIVIPLAIRSFIKERHSDEGNKGDGGDHSGLRSLHGTGTGPLQNRLQASWAQDKSAFDKELTVLGVRGCSRH